MSGVRKLSTIPNETECLRILKEAGASDKVIRHTCTVMLLAVEIGKRTGADLKILMAGGLLHDIGRSRTHGVMHPVAGAEIAREKGVPEEIVHIIQSHIGSGITPEDAQRLGYPPGDYMPHTLEEKIVSISDKLTGGCDYITVSQALEEFERKGLHESGQRMLAMYRELSENAGIELDQLAGVIDAKDHRGPCNDYVGKISPRNPQE